MTKRNLSILAFCIAALLPTFVFAQQSGITAEKRALILEIQKLTGMSGLTVKQDVSKSNIPDSLNQAIDDDKELTDTQKQELKTPLAEAKTRLEKQINEFASNPSVIEPLFENVFLQLYDKSFAEGELQEMAVFYRTPTGQKAGKFMVNVTNQVSKSFGDAFTQKFKEFVDSKLKEEWEWLKQKKDAVRKTKISTG